MSTLESMFSLGPCNVTVANAITNATLFSGNLSFNQSSPIFQRSGGNLQVNVDASGIVTLVSPDSSINVSQGLSLSVTPSYDVTNQPLQASSMSMWGAYLNNGSIRNTSLGQNINLSADSTTGKCSPFSYSFPAASNTSLLLIANAPH